MLKILNIVMYVKQTRFTRNHKLLNGFKRTTFEIQGEAMTLRWIFNVYVVLLVTTF